MNAYSCRLVSANVNACSWLFGAQVAEAQLSGKARRLTMIADMRRRPAMAGLRRETSSDRANLLLLEHRAALRADHWPPFGQQGQRRGMWPSATARRHRHDAPSLRMPPRIRGTSGNHPIRASPRRACRPIEVGRAYVGNRARRKSKAQMQTYGAPLTLSADRLFTADLLPSNGLRPTRCSTDLFLRLSWSRWAWRRRH